MLQAWMRIGILPSHVLLLFTHLSLPLLVLLAALVLGYMIVWLILFEPPNPPRLGNPPAAGGKGGKDE